MFTFVFSFVVVFFRNMKHLYSEHCRPVLWLRLNLVVFLLIAKTRIRRKEIGSFYFFKLKIYDKTSAFPLVCVFRSHEPSLTQNVTASPITTIAPHQVSSKSVKGRVSLITGEMSYKLCELSNFEADCIHYVEVLISNMQLSNSSFQIVKLDLNLEPLCIA